jgi:DNA primase
MGFCPKGLYAGRVIIPSYDSNNKLNYFIARSVFDDEPYKYKNPPVSKNVIMFENQINWSEPITLCEGAFDALSIKRNAIPILGKFIPKKLMDSIYERGVTKINILLDSDAQDQALYYTIYFQKQGIDTKNIIPSEKDASEMGFSDINEIIKNVKPTEFGDIISQKLQQL